MRVYDIIARKRDGKELSFSEINYLIEGYVKGEIPDYQISAWLMAVFLNGMSEMEIISLTKAMINSGDTIDLSPIKGIKVDKHSTGGVGDTTTLVLGPIIASAGIPLAKMSGRGLGHTGGTIDKLEAIPGLIVEMTREKFIKQVNKIKLAIVSQSGNLVPADKKIYALRDVTATVNSIPLIASSIMSKKIAAGSDGIILDVKVGSGAFLKDIKEAKELAEIMVSIGKSFNKKIMAVITNMNQPLGRAVGNSLEVLEAIQTLKGEGPEDLTELCKVLAGHLFVLSNNVKNYEDGYNLAEEILYSGKAIEKFKELVKEQGGNIKVIDDLELLPFAKNVLEVKASSEGYISSINTEILGNAAMVLGAGRERKKDKIDPGVGLIIRKKIGDKVNPNDILVESYYNDSEKAERAEELINSAYKIIHEKVERPNLILDIVK